MWIVRGRVSTLASRGVLSLLLLLPIVVGGILGLPESSSAQTETLVNLTQWPESEGGNNHWYAVVPIKQWWTEHNAEAASYTHDGSTGYLATVTSADENSFITNQIVAGVTPSYGFHEYVLGARRVSGAWNWVTGEEMVYTNWGMGQPTGYPEEVLAIWGPEEAQPGKWNDVGTDPAEVGSEHALWAVIEFGEFGAPPPPPPPPGDLVNLIQWPVSAGGNDHWYAVVPLQQWWTEHNAQASSYIQEGMAGYLATVTSAAENSFIVNQVVAGVEPTYGFEEYLLGGRRISGTLSWVTEEEVVYTNWGIGEPSGYPEEVTAIWGPGGSQPGKWNDVGTDPAEVGPEHRLWAVIEWGEFTPPPPPPPPPGPLVNLVQWPVSEGGNDHWYAVVAVQQWWTEHNAEASSYIQDGMPGYLATATSAEEDNFIRDHVTVGVHPSYGFDEFHLGGYYDLGIWQWVTAEAWSYTNWDMNQPSNLLKETVLAKWGTGKWNNVGTDPALVGPEHQLWAVIEWGDYTTPPPPPPPTDTIINLVQWPAAEGGNDHWYAVVALVKWWHEHDALAPTFLHDGEPAYLATVTSPAEDNFILNHVVAGVMPSNYSDEYLLGGYRVDGQWRWVTNEPFAYANWGVGEPNSSVENVIAKWGTSWPDYKDGRWNNVGTDPALVGPEHRLYGLIEWGSPDTTTPHQDTLINLVKWDAAAGGNDHWYGIIPIVQWWTDHNALAPTLQVEGLTGYLATVTSPEEDAFILNHVVAGVTPSNNSDEYLLGGYLDEGVWKWVSGETFEYANWGLGEPNHLDVENVIAKWGTSWPIDKDGRWNNVGTDPMLVGPEHRLYALVEFGVPKVPTDSLFFLSASGPGCTDCGMRAVDQPVACRLAEPASGATISFDVPAGATICDVSFEGYLTESWDFTLVDIDNDSGFVVVNLANTSGDVLPAGLTTLFDIQFSITGGDHTENFYIHWDTALSDDPGRQTKFSNLDYQTFRPVFSSKHDSTAIIIEGVPGDVNGTPGTTVADLLYIVDFVFRGGPGPCNINLADVNGDCSGPDIGDITYYIAYLFRGGQALREGCVGAEKQGATSVPGDLNVRTSFDGQATTIEIESPVDLLGLQLELADLATGEPSLLIERGLDVVYGHDGTVSHIGVMDLEGEAVIPQGRTAVIRLEGQHEVRAALASDRQHRVHAALLSTGPALPTAYALHQNYPNPFNPSTVIAFDLPGSVETRLEVFNVAGQRVALLVERVLPAGIHEITWDAGNLASGVYVTRLTAGDFSATRKMLLLK